MAETTRERWIDSDKARVAEGIIQFSFPANGATRTYNLGDMPDAMKVRLMAHGAEQKLRDNVASAKKDGLSVSDVIGECDELWKQLVSGEWGAERTGGGESVSLLAAAMLRIRDTTATSDKPMFTKLAGLDVAGIEAWLRENKTKEERKNLRSVNQISIVMSEISLERKKAEANGKPAAELADI